MKYEDQRKETPFATRDNMLNIRNHMEELCLRGFGLRKRKKAKEPKNFNEWSEESREKWIKNQEELYEWQSHCDRIFIEDETKWIRATCREIVGLIDDANGMNPQTEHECDMQRDLQNEALRLCKRLRREINHIADTIPCNKNFLVIQDKEITDEINLISGWRKSCNPLREEAMKKDAMRRLKAEQAAKTELMKELQ